MALIKCPECSHQISDKSVVCVSCGFPIQDHLRRGKKGKLIIKPPKIKYLLGKFKIEVQIDGVKVAVVRNEVLELDIYKDSNVVFMEHSLFNGTTSCSAFALEGKTVEVELISTTVGNKYFFDCNAIVFEE